MICHPTSAAEGPMRHEEVLIDADLDRARPPRTTRSTPRTGPDTATEAPVDTAPALPAPRLRWWHECLFVLGFYLVYSGIRNLFGSATVGPLHALNNAERIISLEKALGLFHEQTIQGWFLGYHSFLRFWNIFYGTFHFVVTAGAMLWLYRRFPLRYKRWRNTLAATTALALLGFSLFPLMPPRLVSDCSNVFSGCAGYGFVDTLQRFGGLWSFDSGAMQSVSNQYAAMPSLHFAWSSWCCLALLPTVRRRWVKALLLVYPWATLFAIIVTANHFWLDAAGGALALGFGFVIGSLITRYSERRRLQQFLDQHRRLGATDATPVGPG
jgi:hypothetical protein